MDDAECCQSQTMASSFHSIHCKSEWGRRWMGNEATNIISYIVTYDINFAAIINACTCVTHEIAKVDWRISPRLWHCFVTAATSQDLLHMRLGDVYSETLSLWDFSLLWKSFSRVFFLNYSWNTISAHFVYLS